MRPQVKIHPLTDSERGQILQLKLNHLCAGMHPSIGTAGGQALSHRPAAAQFCAGFRDHLLDGETMFLPLPAHEGGAVVLDLKCPERQ